MVKNTCLDVIMDINRNMRHMNFNEKRVYLNEWSKFRVEAMKEAEEKFGKLNQENLKDIQKYMKKEDVKWKKGILT